MEEDLLNQKAVLPAVPDRHGTPTISLALLLDFSIQNTSHEITILSELLPKKKEADRKISVVQFAHSTRIIFVKLLAIVKWLRISKKFESLSAIRYFLQQQATIFEETANRLVAIARTELKLARLARLQIPYAIDGLVLGSFPRLPLDIKNRFISREQLNLNEQALTLRRLNEVVLHHIGKLSRAIPPRISSIVVRNGMAIIRVIGEYELCLTLLNEKQPIQWTLLDIKILTECSQIALGQKLVHPLQVNTIHQIVQEKILIGSNPLHESYVVLHSFCQSLQLEVLYYQATRLRVISLQYVRVEDYNPFTKVLVISYWLAAPTRRSHNLLAINQSYCYVLTQICYLRMRLDYRRSSKRANSTLRRGSDYRITIYVDPSDIYSPLKTSHRPMALDYPQLECDHDDVSLSHLLSMTILRRSREYLLRIKMIIEATADYPPVELTGNSVPMLTYWLVFHGTRYVDEALEITVDSYRGSLMCRVLRLGRIEELVQLESELNGNCSVEAVGRILDRLRVLVMIERFNRALSTLQVRTLMNLTLVDSHIAPLLSRMSSVPADRRILQFNREEQYYLVVGFAPDRETGVALSFFLLTTNGGKSNTIRLDPVELAKWTPIPTVGLKTLFEHDDTKMEDEARACVHKWTGTTKQLQSAIAAIDDRLLFLRIADELSKRSIRYHPLAIEPVVGGNVLQISNSVPVLVNNFGVDKRYCMNFFANFYNCALRLDLRATTSWPLECTMIHCPLLAESDDEINNAASQRKRTSCTWVMSISNQSNQMTSSESASTQILERLSIYCHVYAPVKRFAAAYYDRLHKFCSVRVFTYHKLVLAYGDDRNLLMIMSWRPRINKNPGQYTITFAQCQNAAMMRRAGKRLWNPHTAVSTMINEKFNKNSDLIGLVTYLVNSWSSLSSIYNFSRIKFHSTKTISQVLGIDAAFPVEMECHLSVISETQLRLGYGSSNIEFLLLRDNCAAVRDTAALPVTMAGRPLAGVSPAPLSTGAPTPANLVCGFELFWRRQTPDRMLVHIPAATSKASHLTATTSDLQQPPQPLSSLRADSPYHVPPKSFPSVQQSFNPASNATAGFLAQSPSSVISQRMPLSVPPPNSSVGDSRIGTSSELARDAFGTSTARSLRPSIFVTKQLLEQAMKPAYDVLPSPLENYLYGLNYLSRLCVVLDASRRVTGPTNLPLRDLQYVRANARNDLMSLSIAIFTYVQPVPNPKEPSLLRMTFFLDEERQFRLSVKLEYSGMVTPAEEDVRAFATYFERHVSHVYNEMSVLSFIVLCRIAEPFIFASFAQIMRAQLEPAKEAIFVPSLQLTMLEESPMSALNQRRIQCGVAMNETCKRLLFVVSIRNVVGHYSTPIVGLPTHVVGHDRRQYVFIYNVLSNDLTLQRSNNLTKIDETDVTTILNNINAAASVAGAPCSIWTCVRSILEKLTFTSSSYMTI